MWTRSMFIQCTMNSIHFGCASKVHQNKLHVNIKLWYVRPCPPLVKTTVSGFFCFLAHFQCHPNQKMCVLDSFALYRFSEGELFKYLWSCGPRFHSDSWCCVTTLPLYAMNDNFEQLAVVKSKHFSWANKSAHDCWYLPQGTQKI